VKVFAAPDKLKLGNVAWEDAKEILQPVFELSFGKYASA
jgi:hypothetical protein